MSTKKRKRTTEGRRWVVKLPFVFIGSIRFRVKRESHDTTNCLKVTSLPTQLVETEVGRYLNQRLLQKL